VPERLPQLKLLAEMWKISVSWLFFTCLSNSGCQTEF